MPALRGAVTSPSQVVFATDTEAAVGSIWKIGSEAVRVMGCYWEGLPQNPAPGSWRWVVMRRIAGTTATTYANDTALTEFFPESPSTGGGPHTHPEAEVTSLVGDLAGKAPTHTHPYAATSHAHLDADIPAAIARDAEVTSAIGTHAATPHGGSLPAGLIVMWGGLVANIPSGWLLCNGANGTPDLRDRFVKGASAEAGTTGGSATHGHTTTQPTDHAALTHAGTAVANHAVTQPGIHSNHVVTQPGTHAFTQPAGHSAHAFTQPGAHSNHVVTQPNAHADVLNHVHLEQLQGGTTGATTGSHIMASTATGGSLRSAGQSTLNPTANGVASQAHTGSAVDAHSAHSGGAVDAHSAHSGGAVDAHSGAAVDAHSAHSGGAVDAHGVTQPNQHAAQAHSGAAVNTVNSEPAYFALCFIQKT